ERVGRLARLADRDDDRTVFDDRVAIAEFAGVFAARGRLGEILKEIFADFPRVKRGALPGEDETLGAHEIAGIFGNTSEHDAALALVDAAAHAVADRFGLLHDLLEHEVRVAAQFDLLKIH